MNKIIAMLIFLLFTSIIIFTGCQDSASVPTTENNEDMTVSTNDVPGHAPFDSLFGCTVAWTSVADEPGLSSYKDILEDIPWLSDPYISQFEKKLYAIQFTNGDIIILMSTNSIDDLDSFANYISTHTNSLASQLQAKADIEISSNCTIIIISKENTAILKNAVLCAGVGQWPD